MIQLPLIERAPEWAPGSSGPDAGTPYAGYAYSYPHKTSYRRLDPARPLREVWAGEDREALFLYLHVPFCEMRCGFCNLFTTANPNEDVVERYLNALRRQARRAREALGPARFASFAIGGGTPTYLDPPQLRELFRIARDLFDVVPGTIPTSVETSPRTADLDRLRVLREHGVDRVSIGAQSFVEAEVTVSGRAQRNAWVHAAIERMRTLAFPTINIDLIYGLPGQTATTWVASLREALRWRPEELYLYPLYVRPLTGLDRHGRRAEDELRLACYRAGRDLLLSEGYRQVSMRMFRREAAAGPRDADSAGPVYCCQADGMLGLGCGARSYTRDLHYSSEYAVGATHVRDIIDAYCRRSDAEFDRIDYGCELGAAEQRRRWVIKSLLRTEGLDPDGYRARFGMAPFADLPELSLLLDRGLAELKERLVLTPAGLERSDAIGPWLYSREVKERMAAYELH